ncbi:MAG: hypothetical protein JW722_02515 [Demequinaceae bacterium]|nr:hypothetical protein [Demequinaceae bacterium]
MNDLGDVWASVGVVVLATLVPFILFRGLAIIGTPKPNRGDDDSMRFAGRVSYPLDGAPERRRPQPATFGIASERFVFKPDTDDEESFRFSSMGIVKAGRFQRVWGASGATAKGLDLRLPDGRVIRVKPEVQLKDGNQRGTQVSSDSSGWTKWLERELARCGVPFCEKEQ